MALFHSLIPMIVIREKIQRSIPLLRYICGKIKFYSTAHVKYFIGLCNPSCLMICVQRVSLKPLSYSLRHAMMKITLYSHAVYLWQ